MPYKIKGKTVVKADTGKVVGHSDNPKAYLRALYANADKPKRGGAKISHKERERISNTKKWNKYLKNRGK